MTKEYQVYVAEGVRRSTRRGACRWSPVLIDSAEDAFEALPGIIIEHGGWGADALLRKIYGSSLFGMWSVTSAICA